MEDLIKVIVSCFQLPVINREMPFHKIVRYDNPVEESLVFLME